jgi:hypothetical protein
MSFNEILEELPKLTEDDRQMVRDIVARAGQ